MKWYKVKAKTPIMYGYDKSIMNYVNMETNDMSIIPILLSGLKGYEEIEVKPFNKDEKETTSCNDLGLSYARYKTKDEL